MVPDRLHRPTVHPADRECLNSGHHAKVSPGEIGRQFDGPASGGAVRWRAVPKVRTRRAALMHVRRAPFDITGSDAFGDGSFRKGDSFRSVAERAPTAGAHSLLSPGTRRLPGATRPAPIFSRWSHRRPEHWIWCENEVTPGSTSIRRDRPVRSQPQRSTSRCGIRTTSHSRKRSPRWLPAKQTGKRSCNCYGQTAR